MNCQKDLPGETIVSTPNDLSWAALGRGFEEAGDELRRPFFSGSAARHPFPFRSSGEGLPASPPDTANRKVNARQWFSDTGDRVLDKPADRTRRDVRTIRP